MNRPLHRPSSRLPSDRSSGLSDRRSRRQRQATEPATRRGSEAWTGRRRRQWLQAVAAAWGMLALGRTAGAQPAATRPAPEVALPQIGSQLLLPVLTLLDGTQIGPAERQGKTVVLYWWASWCPFCAEQSPLIEALWRSHRDQGLLVIGLSIDRTPEIAAAHLARKGYTFPSAWLSPALAPTLAKPKGLPVTVVIGADDKVLAAESGQLFDVDVAALGALVGGRRRD